MLIPIHDRTARRARIESVLLDVDGTLIDSNQAHAQAWSEALAEAGFRVSVGRIRWLIGMGGDRILPAVASIEADSPLGKLIDARRRDLFLRRHLAHCAPQPGARRLLQRFADEGLRQVIASSARPEELEPLLRRAGVDDLIDQAATSADAAASKPDPGIVQAALQRAGVAAAAAVMLGDTPYDVAAARRAGVRIVALRCGGWDDASLAGAVAIYDDPEDLLGHYDESVFASSRLPPATVHRALRRVTQQGGRHGHVSPTARR